MARKKLLRVAPKYTEDGKTFQTKNLLELYRTIKELKVKKLIKSFCLPTLEDAGKIKTGKYNAIKCTIDEMLFDSVMEAQFYCELIRQKHDKEIKDFVVKPTYELQEHFKKNGRMVRAITYTPDFEIVNLDGIHDAIDIKGRKTDVFALKQKLFDFKFPGIKLLCIRRSEKENRWYDIDAEKKTKKKATPKRTK